MARPKKEKELTRTKHVTVRFSETQHNILSEYAEQAGMTLSEYIRTQLTKGKVVAKYNIVADVPELKKLIAEFGKIGSNLNQIAKHLNQGGSMTQEMAASVRQCMAQIFEMKYEVVKMAGDFFTVRQQADSLRGKTHGGTETHSS